MAGAGGGICHAQIGLDFGIVALRWLRSLGCRILRCFLMRGLLMRAISTLAGPLGHATVLWAHDLAHGKANEATSGRGG